jgi:large subunit ribosomal protein L24
VKARKKQGDESGIIRKEIPLRADKVMLICSKCGKPTRVGHKLVSSARKGKDINVRACKKCGADP